MKRSLKVTLSALALSLVTAPAFASEIAAVNQNPISNIQEITPFDLVTRGYQGSFIDQGIPSNAAFNKAVKKGRVTAVDLVEVAIASGRLSPETINNRVYLNNVNTHLSNLFLEELLSHSLHFNQRIDIDFSYLTLVCAPRFFVV